MYRMKNNKAFSLLELLIALTILAIIIVIAYPTYNTHILKTRRAQAKVTLIDLAARLEQFHVAYNSYKDATFNDLNFGNDNQFYHYQIQTNDDNFLITAVPINTQSKDHCGNLSYNEKGEKIIQGKFDISCW